MIPAQHGKWFARFKQVEDIADEEEFTYEPVIAWNHEGYAMVPDWENGALIRANIIQTFAGLCDAAEVELASMTPEEIRERNKRMREHR